MRCGPNQSGADSGGASGKLGKRSIECVPTPALTSSLDAARCGSLPALLDLTRLVIECLELLLQNLRPRLGPAKRNATSRL